MVPGGAVWEKTDQKSRETVPLNYHLIFLYSLWMGWLPTQRIWLKF